ncbi:MAG TPA: hypothetical protein VLB02_01375 [Candidatus Paceibacterota bacterium]|nr:hypothetical protein [Candidatus Paceibacterota bacterium]
MKKAKQFIISSTFALFLSSSVITSAASYPTTLHKQAVEAAIAATEPVDAPLYLFVPKEDRYQKKMHYKQMLRTRGEKRMYR